MATATKRRTGGKAQEGMTTLDFSGVTVGGGGGSNTRVPEGDYQLRVKRPVMTKSKKSKDMWELRIEILSGPQPGAELVERITIEESTLFKIKGFLLALGYEVPDGKFPVPTSQAAVKAQFAGKTFAAHLQDDDPYTRDDGTRVIKSRIGYFYTPEEAEDLDFSLTETRSVGTNVEGNVADSGLDFSEPSIEEVSDEDLAEVDLDVAGE